ncbi:TolC family protein [Halopseudomonas salegens]|nr:hypothetical protein [Halopseudomonas salegens]
MAVSLQSLLDGMHDTPATLASQHEEQRIDAELQQRRATAGWSLFGGVDSGRFREVETTGIQEFEGYGAQLGLRYPLLGSMQARKASVTDARVSLAQAQQMTELSRAEQRMLLRQTYIDWWQQQALDDWCARQRIKARDEHDRVATRVMHKELRLSEELWTQQRWRSLMLPCGNLQQRMAQLEQRLGYLHGKPLAADTKAQVEALPLEPAPLQQWLPLLEEHPALQVHQAEQQGLQPLTRERWSDRVDASFSLAQSYDRRTDIGGSGSGLVAAITFETPLTGIADSRETPAAAQQRAAHQRYLDARQSLAQTLELTLQQYRQQLDSIALRQLQLDYTRQLILEQQERQRINNASEFMGLRMARLEQADIGLELINDWHAAWSLLAELETLAEQQLPLLSTKQVEWSAKADRPAPASHQEPGWRQSAYIWNSTLLLDKRHREQQINALTSAGFNHVYLGFDAEQVARLEQLSPNIEQLIRQLRQHGFIVDLLLGDPAWISAENRADLLQLIDRFAALPFDHLHLDLEVEQLGWPVPDTRLVDWLQTLEAVSNVSPWPVTLVGHHRWFAPTARGSGHCIPCALPDLDIDAVTIMLYSTAESSVIERTAAIADAWPELKVSLAQSVESTLPQENSWQGSSHGELEALNARLRRQLGKHDLAGLAWQDWQHYLNIIEAGSQVP